MSQGIKNRKLADRFIDEKTGVEYLLSELKVYTGEDYDDLINKLNIAFDNYKIVNRNEITQNKKLKIKSAIYVELVDKKKKYPIVRLFDRRFESLSSAPLWSGSGMLKDFSSAYGIHPRLRSALSSQFVYQPSKIGFSTLLSDSQEVVGEGFKSPALIISALKLKAIKDKSAVGDAIKALLEMLENGSYGVIKDGAIHEREIGIYAAEFIVPLAIALGMTTPNLSGMTNSQVKINTKANHMGFDAAIKTPETQYLVSVKQRGAGRSYGAYGSIAYMQKIISEKEKQMGGAALPENLKAYKDLLDIILGAKIEQKETVDASELELQKNFSSNFTRKTYRNLFILAKRLKLPNDQISNVLKFVGNQSNSLEDKLKVLNKFANDIYSALNKDDFFIRTTKELLEFNNFIQGSLITHKQGEDLLIAGVEVNTAATKKIDISAKKSYYGSKFASGHGGFLLMEILKIKKINNQNQQ